MGCLWGFCFVLRLMCEVHKRACPLSHTISIRSIHFQAATVTRALSRRHPFQDRAVCQQVRHITSHSPSVARASPSSDGCFTKKQENTCCRPCVCVQASSPSFIMKLLDKWRKTKTPAKIIVDHFILNIGIYWQNTKEFLIFLKYWRLSSFPP